MLDGARGCLAGLWVLVQVRYVGDISPEQERALVELRWSEELRFPRRCREGSEAGAHCTQSSNTSVSDYVPIPTSWYELQRKLGAERGSHEWAQAASVEEYLAKTVEAHARHGLADFRKRDPLHFVEVGTSNYNSLAQCAFSDTDDTSSGYLTNEAYGVIAYALRSPQRRGCRGISVEAIPENLKALPVHDRLQKIEAVVGGSSLTKNEQLSLQELEVLNRKFEVLSRRAEALRQEVLESGECWKAKARSVSEEDLNDPEFLEWKKRGTRQKSRCGRGGETQPFMLLLEIGRTLHSRIRAQSVRGDHVRSIPIKVSRTRLRNGRTLNRWSQPRVPFMSPP